MKRLSVVLFFLTSSVTNFSQTFYKEPSETKHWVDSVFKSLSKEERIAQLMVVRLSAKTPDGVVFYDKKVEEMTVEVDEITGRILVSKKIWSVCYSSL